MLHAALLLAREHVQPERGVLRRRRAEEPDPVVHDLEQRPAERSSRDGAIVQIITLHEQVGAARIAAERSHLAP